MTSLRRTLVALSLGVSCGVLGLAGVGLYAATRASRLAAFDADLRQSVERLATSLEIDAGRIRVDPEQVDAAEFERATRPSLLEIVDTTGARPVYRSRGLAGRAMPSPLGGWAMGQARPVVLPGGGRGRATAQRAVPRTEEDEAAAAGSVGQPVTVLLARPTWEMDEALRQLALWIVLIGALAGALLAGTLRWAVRRGLRPVDELAAAIAQLGGLPSGAEVRLDAAPDELRPVVERLNDLLRRLEAAFERERAFSASAAHELRTPLAGLRTTLEVTLSREREAGAYASAMAGCLGTTVAMGRLVDDLLALARLDAGRAPQRLEPCSPADVLREAWTAFAERADAQGQRLVVRGGDAVTVATDRALLERIVVNLLDNAVCYGQNGEITATVAEAMDGWSLSVVSPGSALDTEQAAHATERFWRGDSARSAVGTHCGLGLALADSAATALGGRLSICSRLGVSFEVLVVFAQRAVPPDSGAAKES